MEPSIKCEEVIITDLARRGKGVKHSPIRAIVQVYTKQGELIAENDPSPETFALMDLVFFARWCFKKSAPEDITDKVVYEWLDSIEDKK